MDRRRFIGLVSSGIAASGRAAAFAVRPDPSKDMDLRPNFLFIICDDLTFRSIRGLNNTEIHTPNMDRLVSSGQIFTHCFHQGSWMSTVCIASRTMLTSGLTGFHAQAGIDNVPTWGQVMGRAGYDTYICGKWHLDETVLQRSFKEMGPIGPGMFDSTVWTGSAYNRPSPGNTWEPWDESLKGHWIHTALWANQFPDRIAHSAAIYADCVVDYMKEKVTNRQDPFFMYVAFNSPHDPRQSPREFLDLYPQDEIEVPPNFLPEHPFDQGDYRTRDEMLAPFPRTPKAVQLHRREYYAHITFMDHQIGRILDALRQSGRASNTYVILTADHGLAVGEHGLMGKQNSYDCSIRIPLIISGPSVAQGKRCSELVYQHNMFATTCDLAGIPIPDTVEFRSIASLFKSQDLPVYDAVFNYYRKFQRTVRTKTHKLIFYPQIQRTQIFDLVNDPWEMHDLSADSAAAGIRSDLMDRMRAFQHELGDGLDLEHPAKETVFEGTKD